MAKAIGFSVNRSSIGETGDRVEGRAIGFAAIGLGEGRSVYRWRSAPRPPILGEPTQEN